MTIPLPDIAALFVLTFARVGVLVMLLPGVGEQMVPPRMRLAFAVFLTLILLPLTRPLLPPTGDPAATVATLIGEIAAGLVLGLATRMIVAALQTAGTIISSEIGLSFATTVDPAMGGQDAAIGGFLNFLGLTLIFAMDLHHVALMAIGESYALIPPVGMPNVADAVQFAIAAIGRGFALAVKISAPFIVFGFLFNLGLGILSRLMPQMQVFFLAMPLAILLGLVVLLAVLGAMMGVFIEDLGRFLNGFGSR